jgi:hypothetical protein
MTEKRGDRRVLSGRPVARDPWLCGSREPTLLDLAEMPERMSEALAPGTRSPTTRGAAEGKSLQWRDRLPASAPS